MINELKSLTEGVPYLLANLSNTASYIYHNLGHVNWAGFYIYIDGKLTLGPFCGKPACIEIPMGRGVCGTAAHKDMTVVVPDVHAFEGHIACDGASASEIVVPLHKGGKLWGVLDIDSPVKGRFDAENKEETQCIEQLARIVEKFIEENKEF